MKICLVTSFPPSRRGLNEYGYHIARELQNNPLLSLTVLADELLSTEPELPGFSVVRCWDFNRVTNPLCLLREIRQLQPDVVWFNVGFASYGNKALPASIGLAAPALISLAGFQTHVTLHQLMDTVDLKDAGVHFPTLYKVAGALITRVLLMSDSVSVLLPAYRRILREKYRSEHVHFRPHGILSGRPEYPDFSRRDPSAQRVLAFGKWGTYKRLEPMIEAFRSVALEMPGVRLVVAGGNHPNTPGYVEAVAERYRHDPQIEFTGYVPEAAIGDLFRSASVTVMPYSSSAGSSGVAHLACQYGVPIIASDIRDFRQLAEEEGLAIEFYRAGDNVSLATMLLQLLQSPERQQAMALQNFSVALHMTMPRVIREYLRSFDLQERIELLRSLSRIRRLPHWMPMRSTVGALILRNWTAWRSWLPSPHILQQDPDDLVDGQADGSGTLQASRAAGNDEGESSDWHRERGILAGLPDLSPSARTEQQHPADEQERQDGKHHLLAALLAAQHEPGDDHPQKANGPQQLSARQLVRVWNRGNGNGRNGEHGSDGAASGNNRSRGKGTTQSHRKTRAGKRDRAIEGYGFGSNRDTGAA
ncbi:MAG: group 1 glycosyl transferase [Acidobacteria bacterium]|nr:MAG: group 1 glycosyl transferase [Acidobacteriota bacterium]